MAIKTKIQWCDSTVNPVMGCGGCELFRSPREILTDLDKILGGFGTWAPGTSRDIYQALIARAYSVVTTPMPGHSKAATTTNLWHLRGEFLAIVEARVGKRASVAADRAISSWLTCYAARLHLNKARSILRPTRGYNPGYAPTFETVTKFPGRVVEMARRSDLRGCRRPDKPWLDMLPRLIFLSDMGDAFSRDSDFDFLETEVIAAIRSSEGQRHRWLWLTKRPERMARFGERVGGFPTNVCVMTTLTGPDKLERVDQLRRVPASMRGLSIEPLRARMPSRQLELCGIDWVIIGGESGRHDCVNPFDLAWARELRDHCGQNQVACFIKQLGRRPMGDGTEIRLQDLHGGNWHEWPTDLRVRQIPEGFSSPGFPSPFPGDLHGDDIKSRPPHASKGLNSQTAPREVCNSIAGGAA